MFLLICIDDLITPALFSFILDYSQIIPAIKDAKLLFSQNTGKPNCMDIVVSSGQETIL